MALVYRRPLTVEKLGGEQPPDCAQWPRGPHTTTSTTPCISDSKSSESISPFLRDYSSSSLQCQGSSRHRPRSSTTSTTSLPRKREHDLSLTFTPADIMSASHGPYLAPSSIGGSQQHKSRSSPHLHYGNGGLAPLTAHHGNGVGSGMTHNSLPGSQHDTEDSDDAIYTAWSGSGRKSNGYGVARTRQAMKRQSRDRLICTKRGEGAGETETEADEPVSGLGNLNFHFWSSFCLEIYALCPTRLRHRIGSASANG